MSEISKEELIGKISLEYEKNKSQILYAVKNCNGEFSIVEMEKELDDFYSEEEMPNVSFTYDKGSIECFYFPDDVILEIINSIPRDIKKLTVSDRVARMIDFSEFNLEEVIVISRYTQADDITYKLHHDCKISRVGNYCYDYYDYLKDGNDFYYKAQHLTNEEVLELVHKYKAKSYSIDLDKKYISFGFDKVSVNISAHFEDMSEVCKFIVALEAEGYVVKEVNLFSYDPIDIDYINQNYVLLDKLAKRTDISVDFPFSSSTMNWYEFRSLVETIRWYRELINSYDLSPVEKLAFAYDILKTFEYNAERKNEDSSISREPQKIIFSGNIVCAGYATFLKEVIRGLDPNIKLGTYSLTCFEDNDVVVSGRHMRNIVRINDDKYNIHGIYSLDSTWDSYSKKRAKMYGNEYDALDLYKYFLVPFSKYNEVFPHEEKDSMFYDDIDFLNKDVNPENIKRAIEMCGTLKNKELFYCEINDMFDKEADASTKLLEFNSKSIPKETLSRIIYNVRKAEGYSETEASKKSEDFIYEGERSL